MSLIATDNDDCRLAPDRARFRVVPEQWVFDPVLIDRAHRMACARLAVARRADDGATYLDDADVSALAPKATFPPPAAS